MGSARAGRTIAVTDTGGTTIHVLDADTFETTQVIEVGAGPWKVKIGPSGTMYVTLSAVMRWWL